MINNNFLYVGLEYGTVEPVIRKFYHKNSQSDFRLKKSHMRSISIGYSYYPEMFVEFSATSQPKYFLRYKLPKTDTGIGVIDKTLGTTKVASYIYMMNLIYNLNQTGKITPFVIIGAGIAQITIYPTTSTWLSPIGALEFFKIEKYRNYCITSQLGLGFSRDVTKNLSVNFTTKLQIAYNIKIKYKTLNIQNGQFVKAKPIKRTIPVTEFGIGVVYKLPI